ncbi:MAG: hypothetical protein EOP33_07075 [Rickettsiaceae bacterium]|nr:MAG: hypothetical protein EOP33_07075 [Rickettsiaceae bacterium]
MMAVHFAKQNARQLLQAMLRKKVLQFATQTAYTDQKSIARSAMGPLDDYAGGTMLNILQAKC